MGRLRRKEDDEEFGFVNPNIERPNDRPPRGRTVPVILIEAKKMSEIVFDPCTVGARGEEMGGKHTPHSQGSNKP